MPKVAKDTTKARTACCQLCRKAPRQYRYLINPGTPISRHSTAVHKIRDADVRQQPHFCAQAPTILEIFKDSDILGFNSSRFDIPFLEVGVLKPTSKLELLC